MISQEIAELEAAHQGDAINPPTLSLPPFYVLGVSLEPPSADGAPSYRDHVEQL
jgi:hypothetical protein